MTWGMLVGILCCLLSTVIAAGSMIGMSIIYLFAAQYQFTQAAMWYPLVFTLFFQIPFAFFGTVLWKYIDTNRERQKTRKVIEYYLPNEIADQIAKNKADFLKCGEIVHGPCLCTDASHYTRLSENLDPKELSDFMDKYFEALFRPVKLRHGLVLEQKGDSMLAVWKAPQPDIALRRQACLAALDIPKAISAFYQDPEILELLAKLARKSPLHRSPLSLEHLKLVTRVGLHAGKLHLGPRRTIDHHAYLACGDIVNTASRVENMNKHMGTQILASEEVLAQLDGFLTRDLGKFRPVGKLKPISVHELICLQEECEEKQKRLCESYHTALKTFRSQSWDEAIVLFQNFIRSYGQDGPSEFFIRKCKEYKVTPPGEAWDGVIDLKEK
jgi:adenylate cyclase